MGFLFTAILAGLIATTGMTLVLWAITRSGWTNADMVRALGSAVTGKYENSARVGLIIHYSAGIPIALLYALAIHLIHTESFFYVLLAGTAFGFVHGFAFGFVLVELSEHHPVEQFKEADFQVAVAHLIGHVVYGFLVGLILGLSKVL